MDTSAVSTAAAAAAHGQQDAVELAAVAVVQAHLQLAGKCSSGDAGGVRVATWNVKQFTYAGVFQCSGTA